MSKFLEENQYTRNKVLLYESIFGQDYVSVGGLETTQKFGNLLNLESGAKVLDVGCGIGGSAFYLAQKYGAKVKGLDLLPIMIEMAEEKRKEKGIEQVTFEVADATKVAFDSHSFDAVYSRDTILHIQDKKTLFVKFNNWLKPGGMILITDYCCGPQEKLSNEFKEYVKQRDYRLLTVEQYGKVLEDAGFVGVNAINQSELFLQSLEKELKRFENQKHKILKEFSQSEFDEIVDGWNKKIHRCKSGDHQWGLFIATKP